MERALPFKAAYATSGRSMCRHCQSFIEKDSLRISKRVRSLYFDGIEDYWYHPNCVFLISRKPDSIGQIGNFDNIKWNDQEFLKQKTAKRRSEPVKGTQKVVVSPVSYKRPIIDDLTRFKIEYSPSDEECFCGDMIKKGEIRVAEKEKDTGLFEVWHELKCFVELRPDFKFSSSGSCLPGFHNLNIRDQAIVLKQLPPINDEDLPPAVKRQKQENLKTAGMSSLDILTMKQNEKFINIRETLEIQKVKQEDMVHLLTYNKQRYAKSMDDLKDALADRLTFGSVSGCMKCSGKRKFISGFGYVCVKCNDIDKNPMRSVFMIPPSLKEKYEFLKFYQPNVETRFLRSIAPKSLSFDMMEFEQDFNIQTINHDELRNENTIFYKRIIIDTKTDFNGIAHVYQCNDTKYAATLGFTDITLGYNSFYKLQILKYYDHQDKYSLFRSWGRTGTQIGSSKVDVMSLDMCIQNFEILFFQKSGNMWIDRSRFIKHDFKMYLMDIQDDADVNQLTSINTEIKSKLQPELQNLMSLIFNMNIMKNLMIDFKIDLNKMPLGKLSKSQIEKAFEALQELQSLMMSGISTKAALIDASNKFYTLIPHSFGVSVPPVINNTLMIKQKCDMLNALMDIEIAYNLINCGANKNQHPLDAHYEKLRTEINILDSDSEEYKMIDKYAKNTHAHTHSNYTLQIENVFKIERQGEANRYQLFESLHNKKLLWHGSRTTNFAGILSQGLRIAPSEAPASGYMFGKGIYFADMISKSANYCFADNKNSTGLLLLCEVALGNMYERRRACPHLRLPPNNHSTFGKGRTFPYPDELYRFPNGTKVPYGTPVHNLDENGLELLYNEYIVYNPAQIKTRYLVQVKFNFRN